MGHCSGVEQTGLEGVTHSFSRSNKHTESDLCFTVAFLMIVASLQWCSVDTVNKCLLNVVSIYLFWIMKESHLFLRTEVNTSPKQEVWAIGLKFDF